jgi:hypothetical protein
MALARARRCFLVRQHLVGDSPDAASATSISF